MESYPMCGNAKAKKICMCRAAHLNNNKIVLKVDLPHHHSVGFQYTHYKNICKCKIIAFQERKKEKKPPRYLRNEAFIWTWPFEKNQRSKEQTAMQRAFV